MGWWNSIGCPSLAQLGALWLIEMLVLYISSPPLHWKCHIYDKIDEYARKRSHESTSKKKHVNSVSPPVTIIQLFLIAAAEVSFNHIGSSGPSLQDFVGTWKTSIFLIILG